MSNNWDQDEVSSVGESDNDEAKYNFYANYDTNLAKIIRARDLTSGTRKISLVQAQRWIDSQLNTQRKRAAKSLLENTYYITFNMLFEEVRQLVEQMLDNTKQDETIYLYVSNPSKSFYFMGVIAVYFIRLLGFPDPEIIYNLKEISFKTVMVMDDMSYSGFQLSTVCEELELTERKIKLIVGVVAISEQSKVILSKYPIYLYSNIVIPNLKSVLGKRAFLEILYYFSPGHSEKTQVCVYMDHKLVNTEATFMKILMYGPVLPTDLGYEPLKENEIYSLLNGLVDNDVYLERSTKGKMLEAAAAYIPLLTSVHDDDMREWVPDYKAKKLSFIPFIPGCESPDDFSSGSYLS